MPIVLLAAAAAIVAGAVLAALGRAGEMAMFLPDAMLFESGEVTAPDVALLRPPLSLWGYNAAATEEALRVIARAMTVRDVEIATLRRALAEAQAGREVPAGRPEADGRGQADPAGQPELAGQPDPAGQPGLAGQPSQAGQPGEAGGRQTWRQPEHGAGE